ncbi:FHA domain-containing protein, partial [Candidatus Uabimicrobium amorphum]
MINIRVSNEQGEVLKELQLGDGTHNIGRTPDNTIELRDMKVSRDHAKLIVEEGVCTIVDTNSTTGVFVNEEKILNETELRTGDVIHIGDMVLDISFEEFSGTKIEPNQIGCLRLISGGVSNLHVLNKTETIMGRIPECDIQVMDQMASRQHSKVVLQGGSYFLEDCNSSNGTFLNDIQITKQPLQNGDVIKICNHAYKFEIKDKGEVQMQVVSSQRPTPPPAPAPQPMISTARPTRATPPTMHGYEVSENKKGGSFVKVAALLVVIGLAGVGGYTYKDQIMKFVDSKIGKTGVENNTSENNSNDQNKNANIDNSNKNETANTDTGTDTNENNTEVGANLAKEIAAAEQLLQSNEQELQNILTEIEDHNRQLEDINDQINDSSHSDSSDGQEEVEELKREFSQLSSERKQALNKRNMWKSKAKKVYVQYKKMASGKRPKQPEKKPERPKQPEKKPERPKQPEKKPERPKQPEKKPERPKQPEKQPERPVQPPKQPGSIKITAAQIAEIKKINAIKNKPVDYKKIVTANKCGECHKQEKQVWQKTPHYKTYNDMSKKPRAKGIFKKLGLKGSIKRSGRCSKCHFTQQHTGRKVKAVMGVSCESCHGAG